MTNGDPFNLARFVEAQDGIYARALSEIRAGEKRSHWMWFVFPQIAGLGFSPTSQHYAIRSRSEAEAYLAHGVLGPRLLECAHALLGIEGKTARDIFGGTDEMKLRSCATLFACVSTEGSVFHQVLEKYFRGQGDRRTMELLGQQNAAGKSVR